MGSTGEPDRKRRISASVSPVPSPAAKRKPPLPVSEDKKLDVVVLKYKNQKLSEQVEVQKAEYQALENKFHRLKEKQKAHGEVLNSVKSSWEQLVGNLEVISAETCLQATHESNSGHNDLSIKKDFISRLRNVGATESCGCGSTKQIQNGEMVRTHADVLQNVLSSSEDMWNTNKQNAINLLPRLPTNDHGQQLRTASTKLHEGLQGILGKFGDLHLDHAQLAQNYHNHRNTITRNMAERKRLREELDATVSELEESNHKLMTLKAQTDVTQGSPVLRPLGSMNLTVDKVKAKEKEINDLEATLRELSDQTASRLVEIRRLHEERIVILEKLATFQNTLMSFKCLSSSKAFELLNDQLYKSQAELVQCQTLLEKLQVEKENLVWQEREIAVKTDQADIQRSVAEYYESRVAELEQDMIKLSQEKTILQSKIKEASRQTGRKEVIAEFRELVTTLQKETDIMQSELSKYKDDASELHSVRAEVQSLSGILARKEKQIGSLLVKSAHADSKLRCLEAFVHNLRQACQELKLFLEMFRRESTDTREVRETRDREYSERAHVQILKSSLDEHKLESRVKEANEAEAMSQQKLAAAEAEIANLRQKLEDSRRELDRLSEALKSKHEETETYMSEIESIGQAYEDMQAQNQHLLQQISERDDHNSKLVIEGIKAKQSKDALEAEVRELQRNLTQANRRMDLYNHKMLHVDDQVRRWSEQVARLTKDNLQTSVQLENVRKKLSEIRGLSQQLRKSVDEMEDKVACSRLALCELLVELEKERFGKKRVEEELEAMTRKATALRERHEGSTALQKLRHEVAEYQGILKCGICRDRQKEVVIAKCYHLFCNKCIQEQLEGRHRRCPACGLSFSRNDIKPIYL